MAKTLPIKRLFKHMVKAVQRAGGNLDSARVHLEKFGLTFDTKQELLHARYYPLSRGLYRIGRSALRKGKVFPLAAIAEAHRTSQPLHRFPFVETWPVRSSSRVTPRSRKPVKAPISTPIAPVDLSFPVEEIIIEPTTPKRRKKT